MVARKVTIYTARASKNHHEQINYQLHISHGRRKDFFQEGEGNSRVFLGSQNIFPVGPTEVKFYFTNPKLRDKHFFAKTLIGKHQISKSRGAKAHLLFRRT